MATHTTSVSRRARHRKAKSDSNPSKKSAPLGAKSKKNSLAAADASDGKKEFAPLFMFPRIAPPWHTEAGLRRSSSSAVAAWLSSPASSRALMDLAHDAVIIRNPQNIIESWNVGAQELYGWTRQEAIGRVSHELLGTRFPSDLAPIVQTLGEAGYWEGELDHRRKDGKRITVVSRWSLLRGTAGFPLLIKEINRDVTQERRQLGYLRLLNEVGQAVIEAESMSEALRWTLASISAHTRWCVGRALSYAAGSSAQQPQAVLWHLSNEERFAPAREALERRRIQIGETYLAAQVIASGQPAWIANLSADAYFKNIPELAQAGLVSAFAQPVTAPGINAALLLFSDMPAEIDEPFLSAMSGVAAHLRRLFERLASEEAQRRLSLSLMRAQDDERRRIARELHDSAGQYLGALGLSMEAIRRSVPAETLPAVNEKLAEADNIITRCSAELRTLSHLLHPPLLEDLGLASAVNWYISGFAERSGIQVSAQIPKLPRLDHSVELTLFRVLQESLTNIHRHSGSKTAGVAISADEQSVTLEIRDQGKGIPAETLRGWARKTLRAGVGVSGMRERLNDLGGSFEVASDKSGTRVRASIPLRRESATGSSPGGAAEPAASPNGAAASKTDAAVAGASQSTGGETSRAASAPPDSPRSVRKSRSASPTAA